MNNEEKNTKLKEAIVQQTQFIGLVAERYGYREGLRKKRSDLFRKMQENGLKEIRTCGKRLDTLVDTAKSLEEAREEKRSLIKRISELKQNMNNAC